HPDSYHPPHPTYETYSCDSCGNDSHFGYDCPPRFPLNYEPKPGYIQKYNSYPHDSLSFPQQYPCCEGCRDPHETFQLEERAANINTQPTQYSVLHQPPQEETSVKILQDRENELAEYINTPSWNRPIVYYDDDDDDEHYTIAITPVLPIEGSKDSLIMEDEHIDTIPEKETDEFTNSSVEKLVLSLSESEDISDGEGDLPLCDDFPKSHLVTFSNPLFDIDNDFTLSDDESFSEEDVPMENCKIFFNPLFDLDEEIISTEVNPIQNEVLESITLISPGIDYFDAESNLIESLLNRNTSINSTSKIHSLLDKGGYLSYREIALCRKFYRVFPPSHIPVEDSDPFMEEIDLFLASDGSIPPGIDSDYSDSDGDNLFPARLLHDDPIPLPDVLDFSNVI
nr:hypothetical protein [Tanacetum cinerariifolium]